MDDLHDDKDLTSSEPVGEEEPETEEKNPESGAEEEKSPESQEEEKPETEEEIPESEIEEEKSSGSEKEEKPEEEAKSDTEEEGSSGSEKEEKPEEGTESESEEEEASESGEEPQEKKHHGKIIAAALAALVVIGAAGYIGGAQQYKTRFFPNTTINYIDVSGLPIDEVKNKLAESISDYSLNIIARTGDEELSGKDIGMTMIYDDSMENWLDAQNPYLWGLHLFQDQAYTIDTMVAYDQEQLDEAIKELDCMDPSVMVEAVDACISDYDEETGGYSIVPEVPGTVIDKKTFTAALGEALVNMQPDLVLDETNAYVPAAVTSESEELLSRLDDYNQYADMTVIYHFGSEEEILDGSRLHDWINMDDKGEVSVDRDAVAEYVKYLADKYDTTSQARTLKTTYGPEVTISKGTYGWKIAQSKETDALVDIILTGEGGDREPEYDQKAASRGENDYGNTYVEINLTAQHLYYYKDGSLVIDSDLVSGNESNGHATPDGVYPIAYKQRDRILRGERRADGSYEYESHVNYWMPFNGGIGLHDATWRGSFGGSIYKTNGSHGCINLPFSVAKTIYENIDSGTAVFCYRLGSTEPSRTAQSGSSGSSGSSRSSSSSSSSSSASAAAAVPEIVPDLQQIEDTMTADMSGAVEAPADTGASSGSSNVIVAGQSRNSTGPGETSPAVTAGSSETMELSEAPAEMNAAPAETAAAPVETAAAPVETAAAPVETAAAPVETAAAPVETAAAPSPAPAEVSMEAP